MSLHKKLTHPGADVPGCFGCSVSGVMISTAPSNEGQAKTYNFQRRFAAEFENGDREAYKRLRANGEQPPRIAGSAALEKHAHTSFEIASGQVSREPKALKVALEACSDQGVNPLKAVTKPISEAG